MLSPFLFFAIQVISALGCFPTVARPPQISGFDREWILSRRIMSGNADEIDERIKLIIDTRKKEVVFYLGSRLWMTGAISITRRGSIYDFDLFLTDMIGRGKTAFYGIMTIDCGKLIMVYARHKTQRPSIIKKNGSKNLIYDEYVRPILIAAPLK